jgi:hypothetical protein
MQPQPQCCVHCPFAPTGRPVNASDLRALAVICNGAYTHTCHALRFRPRAQQRECHGWHVARTVLAEAERETPQEEGLHERRV